jgi:uncharacterized protein
MGTRAVVEKFIVDFTPSTDMKYIVDGDNVVLHYRLAFTSRASGKSTETGVTEVFSVRDGLITDIDVTTRTRRRSPRW